MPGKHLRRKSTKVFWCSAHGKFVGFQWGGHRRTCKAPPGKAKRPSGRVVDIARKLAMVGDPPHVTKEKIGELNRKAGLSMLPKASQATKAEVLVKEVRSHLAHLNEEIGKAGVDLKTAEKAVESNKTKLSTLGREREGLIKSFRELA